MVGGWQPRVGEFNCVYRRAFERWLQHSFLPPFASQLTSLHLAFRDHWGTAPGYFDGNGLLFPNLKSLTLGKFVIGHHNHFDWVLAQKSLEILRLDRCAIASYLAFSAGSHDFGYQAEKGDIQDGDWVIPAHDWEQYPDWSFGFHRSDTTFRFL